MMESNSLMNKHSQQQKQAGNKEEITEPRKDHYSYSYSYKTADPESGQPGLNSVEVNESVTEEVIKLLE